MCLILFFYASGRIVGIGSCRDDFVELFFWEGDIYKIVFDGDAFGSGFFVVYLFEVIGDKLK